MAKKKISKPKSNRIYSIKAIGIPCISDDIASVETKYVTERLGLEKQKIHRGKGAVDLLIGIDHAQMHTGETRQVGNLVARNSPLGWLVFGATPGSTHEAKRVFHVRVSLPVDLSDF